MKQKLLMVVLAACLPGALDAQAALSRSLSGLVNRDTVVNVWVVFDAKPVVAAEGVTPRALARRQRAGFVSTRDDEAPIAPAYLEAVRSAGGRPRQVVKWLNAASFSAPSQALPRIAALPFVKHVGPVLHYRSLKPAHRLAKPVIPGPAGYGPAYHQLAMLGVPWAQAALAAKTGQAPGSGVLLASFDSGFWLEHPCMAYLLAHNAVVADSDFVSHDGSPYTYADDHGAQTLAMIVGYDPPRFLGTAWGCQVILARTENEALEQHVEEDNWAAAMVWAESLGVDIVTSSLAYREGFTDSLGNPDTAADYAYEELDGKTTIVAAAARAAAARGVLIVNAMGNEGNAGASLCSPADVQDVIAVGAVDVNGRIAGFSSGGPTADGRIKPDLVAMGANVAVPLREGYATSSGTSFSTPLIAGLTALLVQAFPSASSETIRQRLYRSCSLTPFQDSVDNLYGRGLPDAFLAIGHDTLGSYLQVSDSLGMPLQGAIVSAAGASLGATDSFGVLAVAGGDHELPMELNVSHPDFSPATVSLSVAHSRQRVVLVNTWFYVRLIDSLGGPVPAAEVYLRPVADTALQRIACSPAGVARIARKADSCVIYGSAPGYLASSPATVGLSAGSDTVTILLAARPASRFAVYPNVLSARRLRADPGLGLTIEFCASPDKPREYDQLCRIAIRSIDGQLLWSFDKYLRQLAPLSDAQGLPLVWHGRNGRGELVAPGVYFVVLRYAGKTHTAKILING